MNPFLTRFSIRDLEGFSGVKAHTIRIWERRYGLLAPSRTTTNIRTYGVEELRTLMNVAYLNRHGVKISKIAALSPEQRSDQVRELATRAGDALGPLNTLVLAMVSYDEPLFRRTSLEFEAAHGFRALVEQVYLPFLEQVGLLWQTRAICPAQEHFTSNLVRQRLAAAIERTPPSSAGERTFVLYLPEHEIHELGLLYLHYVLRSHGARTIYLGESVPTPDLAQVTQHVAGPITFVGIYTAFPPPEEMPQHLLRLRNDLPDRARVWLYGARFRDAAVHPPTGVAVASTFTGLMERLLAEVRGSG